MGSFGVFRISGAHEYVHERPKVVEFRNELPKTPVGKILRRELRDKV